MKFFYNKDGFVRLSHGSTCWSHSLPAVHWRVYSRYLRPSFLYLHGKILIFLSRTKKNIERCFNMAPDSSEIDCFWILDHFVDFVISREISWNPMKSHEIPWNPIQSIEIHWKSYEIPWNCMKFQEMPWNRLKSHEIPWNPMKSHEITWNAMKSLEPYEIPWNPMKCLEIP